MSTAESLYIILSVLWHKCRYQLLSSVQMVNSIYFGRGWPFCQLLAAKECMSPCDICTAAREASFMWMLPNTCCISCFPFISPPLSFCVLLHNKCAVPQYLEVYCLDKRTWKKQLLICKHICDTEQYQVRFIYCFKFCQAAWLNSTSAAFCVKHQNIYICKT
jgi:hypothetical protein